MQRILLILLLFSLASADELYVSNTLFEHTVVEGQSVLLNLQELGKALELEVSSKDGLWNLAEQEVQTVELSGKVWIRLADLPPELVTVKKSEALGTIDVYKASNEPVDKSWGGDSELVYYFLKDSLPCKAMEATMQTLEESRQIRVVRIDVDQGRSKLFKKYRDLFQTDTVPFFVLLDGDGYYLHHFKNFKTYPQMMEEIRKGLAK